MSEYPVEVETPDIEPYRAGNTGISYYTSFAAPAPGPHLLLNALTHGNEPCGAIALDALMRAGFRPLRGTLTLGFANVAAYRRFDPANPSTSRYVDEDLNRLWSPSILDGPRRSCELTRAREIRPLLDTVDLVLDIHSMQHRTAPLMLAGPAEKGLKLARAIGYPAYAVRDSGHLAGPRLRDYPRFVAAESGANALLVECGQHWSEAAAHVALETVMRLLLHLGMVGRETAAPHLEPDPTPQQVIEVTDAVTIETDRFTFDQPFIGMEVVARAGTPIGRDGDRAVLAPYDDCILIMPSRRLARGQTAVRLGRFIP